MQVLIIRLDAQPALSGQQTKTATSLRGASLRQRLATAQNAALYQLAARMCQLTAGEPVIPGDVIELVRKAVQKAVAGSEHLTRFRTHMLKSRIRRATMRPWESDLPHAANQYREFRALAATELAPARAALLEAEAALANVQLRLSRTTSRAARPVCGIPMASTRAGAAFSGAYCQSAPAAFHANH